MMRSRTQRPALRKGFTLLEVLLASFIATLLMGGLYVAMDVQLRQSQEAREIVDQATLVRSLMNRLTTDLTPSLSPVLGRNQYGGASGAADTSSSGSDPSATGATGAASGSPSSSGQPSSGGMSGSSAQQVVDPSSTAMPWQAGVVGTATELTIFVTRVPGVMPNPRGSDEASGDAQVTPSDVRRISYWLAANGGLCRQETPWLTSEEALNSIEPDTSNEAQYIIADEVVDVSFEYLSGGSWAGSWDGSQLGDDLKTPTGPPMAIAVTLTVRVPGSSQQEKRYRHVIAIPTAPAPATASDMSTQTSPMP